MSFKRTLAAVSLILMPAGCARDRQAVYDNPETSPEPPVVTVARPAADVTLETELRNKLTLDDSLAALASSIQIAAQSGNVLVTGTVPSETDRARIDALVRDTEGVVSVDDQLLVAYPPPTGGPVERVYPAPPGTAILNQEALGFPGLKVQASTEADQVLAGRILARLRSDAIAPLTVEGVVLNVTGREVYLHGFVGSKHERHEIVSAVEHVPGVQKVHDHLHLR